MSLGSSDLSIPGRRRPVSNFRRAARTVSQLVFSPGGRAFVRAVANGAARSVSNAFSSGRSTSSGSSIPTFSSTSAFSQPRRFRGPGRNMIATGVSGGANGGNHHMVRSVRRSRRKTNTLRSVAKKVNKLTKKVSTNYSQFDSFSNDAFGLTSAINRCNYGFYTLMDASFIELTLAKIPWVNPAAVATKTDIDTTTVTKPTKFAVNTHARFCIRNNNLIPAVVDAYILQPKSDSAISPTAAISNGLAAMQGTAAVVDISPSFYPTTSKYFRDNWKIVRHVKRTIETGAEIILSHNEKFTYDMLYKSTVTSLYKKKYTRILLVRTQGVCAHDLTTPGLVGWAASTLDMIIQRKISLTWPGNLVPIFGISDSIGVDALADDVVGVQEAMNVDP